MNVRTTESAPIGLVAPALVASDLHGFEAVWTSPIHPNGAISSYSLWVSGPLVLPNATTALRTVALRDATLTQSASPTQQPTTPAPTIATSTQYDMLDPTHHNRAVPAHAGNYIFNGSNALTLSGFPGVGPTFTVAMSFQALLGRSGYLFAKSDNVGNRYYSL